MFDDFPLFPEQASTLAPHVDALYFYLTAVSAVFGTLIFFLVIYFAVKYRRRRGNERAKHVHPDMRLEILWSVVPLVFTMTFFGWGAVLYFAQAYPPADAFEIFVVGKQWMWKFQHPEGNREINELHVPVGRAVKLKMTSEDVIHSLFIPAFRAKMDAVPGRYTGLWFQPTKTGTYHLFCAEYCGTKHSGMIGRVIVMKPEEYAEWLTASRTNIGASLALAAGNRAVPGGPVEEQGKFLVEQLNCNVCHGAGASVPAPPLEGLYGKTVKLADGSSQTADDAYIRESILRPRAKIVAGFAANMPTFEGILDEEQVMQIISYIKSLGEQEQTGGEQA